MVWHLQGICMPPKLRNIDSISLWIISMCFCTSLKLSSAIPLKSSSSQSMLGIWGFPLQTKINFKFEIREISSDYRLRVKQLSEKQSFYPKVLQKDLLIIIYIWVSFKAKEKVVEQITDTHLRMINYNITYTSFLLSVSLGSGSIYTTALTLYVSYIRIPRRANDAP